MAEHSLHEISQPQCVLQTVLWKLPSSREAMLTHLHVDLQVEYKEAARVLKLVSQDAPRRPRLAGTVAILSGGTADGSVAEECRVMADAMGCYCFRISDLSVDGLHRVLQNIDSVRSVACSQ